MRIVDMKGEGIGIEIGIAGIVEIGGIDTRDGIVKETKEIVEDRTLDRETTRSPTGAKKKIRRSGDPNLKSQKTHLIGCL